MARYGKAGPEMTALLQRVGSTDALEAAKADREFALALTVPLRQGLLVGDITADIFSKELLGPGVEARYPLDVLAPGTEKDFVAYTMPAQGRIPMRHLEGGELTVTTYEVGASIDFKRKYARDARWNVVGRALQVLEGSFVRKKNTDAFRTLISAGYANAITVFDDRVAPKYMSKRLIELMKTILRRRGGGNTSSVNRGRLTRLYVSPEASGDIRNWTLVEVDDQTRREIFLGREHGETTIFGVEIRDLDELGVNQEFQNYWSNVLGAAMPPYTLNGTAYTKAEICIGLDLSGNDAFVNPVREDLFIQEDPTEARNRRVSFWGMCEHGWAVLDSRRVLMGAI